MKITRQAKREAKQLYRLCLVKGLLDEHRVRQVVERILATGASADEISEALSEVEDEHGFGEQAHRSSSPCVAEVRALLDELDVLDEDAVDDDARM